MINNFTDINKTNYHLSSQIIDHTKHHDIYLPMAMQFVTWDRHSYEAGLNQSMNSPFDNLTSNDNISKHLKKKPTQIRFH